MKQFKRSLAFSLTGVYLIIFASIFWPFNQTYGCTTTYQVDIATTPASGFLKAYSIAPGDEIISILNVQNKGNLDFNYSVSSSLQNDSVDLFNKLQLTLSDSSGVLYEGNLSGLKDQALGTIAKGGNSNLTFKALFPKDSDNAYQGKSINVAFNFNAVGHDEQVPIINGCFEPPFSNNQFILKPKSIVPIKFHLYDSYGNLEKYSLSGIKLVISGPKIGGGTVNYVFSSSDGSLEFDKSLDEPHYMCKFSSKYYPVVLNGTYTAAVYDNEKLLFSKSFLVSDQGNRSNAP